MTYRIVKAIEKSGKNRYYIQKRFLFWFWLNLSNFNDWKLSGYKIYYDSQAAAQSHLSAIFDQRRKDDESKITQKSVVAKFQN